MKVAVMLLILHRPLKWGEAKRVNGCNTEETILGFTAMHQGYAPLSDIEFEGKSAMLTAWKAF